MSLMLPSIYTDDYMREQTFASYVHNVMHRKRKVKINMII